MLSVACASASRDLESHGQNFPHESFWNSWVPGLATLARDTSVCHVAGSLRISRSESDRGTPARAAGCV